MQVKITKIKDDKILIETYGEKQEEQSCYPHYATEDLISDLEKRLEITIPIKIFEN